MHTAKHEGDVFGALLTGIAIGAAAIFFAKKDNRKNVAKKLQYFLDMGNDKVDEISEKIDHLKDSAKKRVSEGASELQDKLEDTEKKVRKIAK